MKIEKIGDEQTALNIFTPATPEEVNASQKAAAKQAAKNLKDFNLHVLLVQETEGNSVSAARAVAYSEGREGLDKRLGRV